jgi:antirestriction protein ArdC
MTTTSKKSVADIIAEKFITSLEAGVAPWQKPWASINPQNGISRKGYSGVNFFNLALFAGDDYFVTYKQALALGGQVQKGAKGNPVLFWTKVESKKADEKEFMISKFYTVFAVKDCGIPDFKRDNKRIDFVPVDEAEKLVALNRCPVVHGGASACYAPAYHKIQMPIKESFKTVAQYYATLFHEIGHSMMTSDSKIEAVKTGKYTDDGYAKEELVAELFASIALNQCGLISEVAFDNSTAYIANWLKHLKDDTKLVQRAGTEAFKRWNRYIGKDKETVAEPIAE